MSWNITSAGKGADVKEHVQRQVEYACTQAHNSDAAKAVIRSQGDIIASLCLSLLEKRVFAEASGHVDDGSSSCRLEFRRIHGYPE